MELVPISVKRMFENIREAVEISRLNKTIRRERKIVDEEMERIAKEAPWDLDRYESSSVQYLGRLVHKIEQIQTDRLLRIAAKYGVPRPTWGDADAYLPDTGILTDQGSYRVRVQIREERKHRRDAILAYLNWLVALLSLLVALAAVLPSYREDSHRTLFDWTQAKTPTTVDVEPKP
jgi:hypothetical protein